MRSEIGQSMSSQNLSHRRYANARRELAREETYFLARCKVQKRLGILKWIAVALGIALVLDLWVLPEQYKRVSDQWAWSWGLGLMVLAIILLAPGFKVMDSPSIFKRWTFWLAVFSAVLVVFVLAQRRWLHGPHGILIIVALGALSFDWFSKRLSAIDSDRQDKL